jgi:CheY-like chemotaxis protein
MSKLKVLVIEDEVPVQEIYLGLFGWSSTTCVKSGEEAMAVINAPWDLIISGQQLGGRMPGRDIYTHLVAYHPHLSSKFIFITSNQDELEGLPLAPRQLLSKPFDKTQVVDLAQGVFDRHECTAV